MSGFDGGTEEHVCFVCLNSEHVWARQSHYIWVINVWARQSHYIWVINVWARKTHYIWVKNIRDWILAPASTNLTRSTYHFLVAVLQKHDIPVTSLFHNLRLPMKNICCQQQSDMCSTHDTPVFLILVWKVTQHDSYLSFWEGMK